MVVAQNIYINIYIYLNSIPIQSVKYFLYNIYIGTFNLTPIELRRQVYLVYSLKLSQICEISTTAEYVPLFDLVFVKSLLKVIHSHLTV